MARWVASFQTLLHKLSEYLTIMPEEKDFNCEYVFINIEELPFVSSVTPLNWEL